MLQNTEETNKYILSIKHNAYRLTFARNFASINKVSSSRFAILAVFDANRASSTSPASPSSRRHRCARASFDVAMYSFPSEVP